jgi:hypothetical protein
MEHFPTTGQQDGDTTGDDIKIHTHEERNETLEDFASELK